MNAGAQGGQQRARDAIEPEVQGIESHLIAMLGAGLQSSKDLCNLKLPLHLSGTEPPVAQAGITGLLYHT